MANKINIWFLGVWMTVISIGMFQFGYSIAMFNSFTNVLFYQYVEKADPVIKNLSDFNAVITTMVPLGAAVGAFSGGALCSLGRRNALFIVNFVIMVGAGITMIFNFYALVIGRLLLGFGVGAFTVISPLFISETSPAEVAGSMGGINQFMVTAGIMAAYFMGFAAPYEFLKGVDPDTGDRNGAVYTTQSWRIVFIIPAGIAIIQSLLVLFVFRHDTPKYYLQNEKEKEVESVEALIYIEKDTEINRSMIESNNNKQNQKVPISALFTPRYRKAFIIGCLLAVFQQLTGINAVIFYSNDIFVGDRTGFESERAAKIGTVIVGIVNWAFALMSIPLLTRFGRKTLLIFGQLGMGSSLLVLAILSIIGFPTGIIVFTLIFVAFFELSIGPILWLYAAEIMTESGMAAASLITWIVTIIFGLFTSRLFQLLTPKGMYFTFTGIDILGLLFILFFIKETKGRSKAEIESLYSDTAYSPKTGMKQVDDEYLRTSDV